MVGQSANAGLGFDFGGFEGTFDKLSAGLSPRVFALGDGQWLGFENTFDSTFDRLSAGLNAGLSPR
jgi:hypothetical protein